MSLISKGGRVGAFKLLVLDVDGTLLNSQGEIGTRTLDALRRAAGSGLQVTLATGRRLVTVTSLCAQMGITLPVILQSGAQIADPATGDSLYCNALPTGDVGAVLHLIVAAGLQPIVYENKVRDQHLLIGPAQFDSAPTARYASERPHLLRRLAYDELALLDDVLEVAAIDDLARVKPLAAAVTTASCRALISYSAGLDSYFVEVFNATCSKGEALRHLAARLGIDLDEVIAVGDNYNDREMLQTAGLGVAMANAEPEILAVADHVTGSNDNDGIAELIAQFL